MNRSRHVYLVDDDSSARGGLSRLLRAAGYTVHAFSSPVQFLAEPDLEPAGCIILDARMPELSGAELQTELRVRGIGLPLIFVTAEDDPEIRRQAHEMHAAAFFRKPVDGPALLDAIEWAISPEPA